MFTPIEIRQNRDGQSIAYIEGTRGRVQVIVMDNEFHGMSVDEIAAGYPHIILSHIHPALAYYFDHKEAILNHNSAVDLFRLNWFPRSSTFFQTKKER